MQQVYAYIYVWNTWSRQTAAALHHVYDTDDKALKGLKACILKEKCNKNDTSFAGEKKIVLYTDRPRCMKKKRIDID